MTNKNPCYEKCFLLFFFVVVVVVVFVVAVVLSTLHDFSTN